MHISKHDWFRVHAHTFLSGPEKNKNLCRKAIVPASLIIAALGAVSAYTFVLIGRSCAETNAESYEQSWARTVGQRSAWVPAGACVATCFAGCLAFTIIIGDSFSALAKTFGAPALVAKRSNIIMAVSATVLLPLSLLKSERIISVCTGLYARPGVRFGGRLAGRKNSSDGLGK